MNKDTRISTGLEGRSPLRPPSLVISQNSTFCENQSSLYSKKLIVVIAQYQEISDFFEVYKSSAAARAKQTGERTKPSKCFPYFLLSNSLIYLIVYHVDSLLQNPKKSVERSKRSYA